MAVKLTEFLTDLPQTADFHSIVMQQTPLIDVRAPIEFALGAFPTAVNLPLMNDLERQKIGLCYKQHGNSAAVKMGHQLVNETVRAPRVQDWSDFMANHPDALLYCFRGGMRSKISQQWLMDQGKNIVRLKGGYKAFRRYLIDFLDSVPHLLQHNNIEPLVLAGRTGSGKTRVIEQVRQAIDLEGLAHHRGSAFGRHATPQPTQINFENALSMALIRYMEAGFGQLVVEDEARNIGSVSMPKPLFEALKSGKRIVVDTPLQTRIQITHDEYVIQAQQEYSDLTAWVDFMQNAFTRIQKRLGGERYQRVVSQFNLAVEQQMTAGEAVLHKAWIHTLLTEYYDPMYDYQMQKNPHPICFKGSQAEVSEFLRSIGDFK